MAKLKDQIWLLDKRLDKTQVAKAEAVHDYKSHKLILKFLCYSAWVRRFRCSKRLTACWETVTKMRAEINVCAWRLNRQLLLSLLLVSFLFSSLFSVRPLPLTSCFFHPYEPEW